MNTFFYFLELVLLFHIFSNTLKNTPYRQLLLLQWYNCYNGTIVTIVQLLFLRGGVTLFESNITF